MEPFRRQTHGRGSQSRSGAAAAGVVGLDHGVGVVAGRGRRGVVCLDFPKGRSPSAARRGCGDSLGSGTVRSAGEQGTFAFGDLRSERKAGADTASEHGGCGETGRSVAHDFENGHAVFPPQTS